MQEAEMGRIAVPGQPEQKSLQDLISTEKIAGIVAYICHPSDSGKHKIRGSWSRQAWAKSKTLFPK
jgi:hypothetical protein